MSAITITSANLPPGFCALTNAQWQTLVSLLSVRSETSDSAIIISATMPSPADWNKLWFRLNSDGTPDKIYRRANGMWLSPHPLPPGFIAVSVLTSPEIPVWDGGEGTLTTPVTSYSGPMWLPLTHESMFPDTAGRLLLQAGQIPGTSTVKDPGETGGTATHTLTVDQLPPHTHSLNDTGSGRFGRYAEGGGDQNPWGSGNSGSWEGEFYFSTQPTGGGQAFGKMPPYYTVNYIVRTARLYYRV